MLLLVFRTNSILAEVSLQKISFSDGPNWSLDHSFRLHVRIKWSLTQMVILLQRNIKY